MGIETIETTSSDRAMGHFQEARSGGQAVVEALHASNVELVIGYSGGGTGAVIHHVATSGMANMNARTELSGAWISYGYNRVKGRAASACLFHCVGALHASPVVYAAKTDSTPFFMMDVNLDSSLDFREGLQDSAELLPAFKPIAKQARKAVIADDLPLAVRQAVLAASTGRPGSAVLDIAFQALTHETACVAEPLTLPEPPAASEATILRILDMIGKASAPVLFVGGGIHLADATAELQAFAEALQIPVVSTSWGGRGAISDEHPLFAGVVGSFGWVSANELVQKSDLWIAIGTTFSQMTTGAWNIEKPKNVIQIDVDPNQLGKIFQPTLGVTGHARIVLQQLLDSVEKNSIAPGAGAADLDAIAASKQSWYDYHAQLCSDGGSEKKVNQYYLIDQMSKLLPDNSLVVGDSGGQAFMLYRSFHYKNVTPMPLGSRYMSLGAGLPIAIGAKLAAPERTVVSYHGDGGFYYDCMELSTLAERKIKLIVIIDNNHCLYANRQGMSLWGIQNPWVDLPESTDFVALAKAQGVEGERVTNPADLPAALERAIAAEGSYILDVWTDPETRIRRAIRDVIPILSDRKPQQGAGAHMGPPLEGSWPA
ncbi:thiamine pyrophosphate-binding protein [Sphingobium sp. JS3065]|uniref:thiamine pyrophosphate-binding protein n=1 Tax=Sphingobium sp. JS3065 TaxID=2970925 RepID=UPI002264F6B7|nr:thiamine pyrophosphate-binding protein [Sphingobium sp. JS3065]UZW57460.1 thiamine pyrophosphate-binding protein [Sphingobium sp. JS3065]